MSYQRPASGAPRLSVIRSARPLTLALTWMPRVGTTADAVRGVAQRRAQNPERINACLTEIGELTAQGSDALTSGDLAQLGALFDRNHELLRELGVSNTTLDERCAYWRDAGARGAKLSGAGCGGVCLGLFEERERAERAAAALDAPTWVVELPASR